VLEREERRTNQLYDWDDNKPRGKKMNAIKNETVNIQTPDIRIPKPFDYGTIDGWKSNG
jgi:hypothetical protein